MPSERDQVQRRAARRPTGGGERLVCVPIPRFDGTLGPQWQFTLFDLGAPKSDDKSASVRLPERFTTDLYRKRPGRNRLNNDGGVEPGCFGPSRKKEAAARRFGNYELWVLNAAMIRTTLDNGQAARRISWLTAGVITAAGETRCRNRGSKMLAVAGSDGETHAKRGVPESTPRGRYCSMVMSYQGQQRIGRPRIEVEKQLVVR